MQLKNSAGNARWKADFSSPAKLSGTAEAAIGNKTHTTIAAATPSRARRQWKVCSGIRLLPMIPSNTLSMKLGCEHVEPLLADFA